ncbi:MAG: hypothetical protein Q4F07_06825 [Bacteroidales bacterium]|nr:hypothetical protein [Bacteroidales bacterium]
MEARTTRVIHFVRKGQTGSRGPALRGPQLWRDLPEGYAFQSGADGDEYKDIVIYNDYYYSCRTGHSKTAGNAPLSAADTATHLWQLADPVEMVAAQILMARYGLVRNLGVENVEMYDRDGNMVFYARDGIVRCNTGIFRDVEISGALTSGDPAGKRIEITPDSKAITIYDQDGIQCACLDGSFYDSSDGLIPYAGTPPQFSAVQYTLQVSAAGSPVRTVTAVSGYTVERLTTLRFHVSHNLYFADESTGETGGDVILNNTAELCCVISSSSGNVQRIRLASVIGSDRDDGSRDILLTLIPGTYTIAFELSATMSSAGITALGYVTVPTDTISVQSDKFLSRWFANGFALTQNTDNYLMALYEQERMRLLLAGDFIHNGTRQPYVVFAARVDHADRNAVPILTVLTKPASAPRPTLTHNTSSAGYTFNFPAGYGSLSSALVEATGIGNALGGGPAKASVATGPSAVTVTISDDETANHGSFFIKISRF